MVECQILWKIRMQSEFVACFVDIFRDDSVIIITRSDGVVFLEPRGVTERLPRVQIGGTSVGGTVFGGRMLGVVMALVFFMCLFGNPAFFVARMCGAVNGTDVVHFSCRWSGGECVVCRIGFGCACIGAMGAHRHHMGFNIAKSFAVLDLLVEGEAVEIHCCLGVVPLARA
jgi:hypothetical protein